MIDFLIFSLYWIGLGVASSIGLGTGLHTFILYLGPHIFRVVLAANECNSIPVMQPSRWKFDHFGECKAVHNPSSHIGFWTIYEAVLLEAFLWGAGTAIGELPPYFVSRAASMAGSRSEELSEILSSDSYNDFIRKSSGTASRTPQKSSETHLKPSGTANHATKQSSDLMQRRRTSKIASRR